MKRLLLASALLASVALPGVGHAQDAEPFELTVGDKTYACLSARIADDSYDVPVSIPNWQADGVHYYVAYYACKESS